MAEGEGEIIDAEYRVIHDSGPQQVAEQAEKPVIIPSKPKRGLLRRVFGKETPEERTDRIKAKAQRSLGEFERVAQRIDPNFSWEKAAEEDAKQRAAAEQELRELEEELRREGKLKH